MVLSNTLDNMRCPSADHMRKQAPWTPEQDGLVAEWRAAGLTWWQIATRLGRSESAVRNRFHRKLPDPAPKQIERIPAEVLAERDARVQARFDAYEADPLSLFFGDPVRSRTRRND